MAERPLLVLIDGHAVAYRAYFALPVEQFSTMAGEPTNAIYGFTRLLIDLLKEKPDYLAVTFDRGLSGRDKMYEEYKGTREKMPDDLRAQIETIEEVVNAFNMPILMMDGFEADDVIGTIAQQAEAQDCRIRIITGDRDLLQLLTEHTVVQLPQRGSSRKGSADKIWTLKDFAETYTGLSPLQLTDYKGLVGDTSDNIPGVKGVGDKTALKLLAQFATVEAIYEHLDEVETRWRTKLEESKDLAFLSKELATIQRDIPVKLDLESCVSHDFDGNTVREIFRRLEFRTLSRDLEVFLTGRAEDEATEYHDELAAFIPPHTIVRDPKQLEELVAVLNSAKMIAFDTETTGTDKMLADLVGISLSVDGKHGYYIPVGHINPHVQPSLFDDNSPPDQLPLEDVINALRPAMTNPDIGKVAHNALFDVVMFKRYGIEVKPITEDTLLAEWVHNPSSKFLGLKTLSYHRLKIKMQEISELIGSGSKQITMDRAKVEDAAGYAAADAVVTYKLVKPLQEELKNPLTPRARDLYENLELPLIPVLTKMEMEGVLLDEPYLRDLSVELTAKQQKLEQQIYDLAGVQFNVNSYQQLNEILFDKLKLPTEGLSKTKTGGFSLTASVLDELAERIDHPILKLIMEQRSLAKLLGTYVDALPALINPATGRVHTSFNQTGAVTGRFSSSNPNLQNIPIRTDEGRRVRKAFIADAGNLLLAVDYSQIELRILAHYSDDKTLKQAFLDGKDIHTMTAAKVHGIAEDKVSYNQRRFAKSVNFGLMYGMGAFRLARDSDLTLSEAEAFIKAYFENFPGVKDYLENTKDWVSREGYVETLFGRRRLFPELTNEKTGKQARSRAEREAINAPIQGTAADIIKKAMIDLDMELVQSGSSARLLLQVHDELVLEVPTAEIEQARDTVVQIMEAAGSVLDVPVIADAKMGKNWLEME